MEEWRTDLANRYAKDIEYIQANIDKMKSREIVVRRSDKDHPKPVDVTNSSIHRSEETIEMLRRVIERLTSED